MNIGSNRTFQKTKWQTREGFSLAGADGKWHWADEATISGDKVIVSAKAVPNPVKVRYAYAINPVANLYNKEGFPAVPFGD